MVFAEIKIGDATVAASYADNFASDTLNFSDVIESFCDGHAFRRAGCAREQDQQ
jgi:hypothetical protein